MVKNDWHPFKTVKYNVFNQIKGEHTHYSMIKRLNIYQRDHLNVYVNIL